jgi:hypothetical protein
MPDDITRHLANLSAEDIAQNMASWEQVIAQIETMLEKKTSKYWTTTKLEFIREVANARESRLFRAGLSRVYLTISTARKLGLARGDRFLRLIWNENNIPAIEYCKFGKTAFQSYTLNTFDDPLFQLLPYLKRLWYESRDRDEAPEARP